MNILWDMKAIGSYFISTQEWDDLLDNQKTPSQLTASTHKMKQMTWDSNPRNPQSFPLWLSHHHLVSLIWSQGGRRRLYQICCYAWWARAGRRTEDGWQTCAVSILSQLVQIGISWITISEILSNDVAFYWFIHSIVSSNNIVSSNEKCSAHMVIL